VLHADSARVDAVTTILVFRIGQLGDTLASLPAIRAIRAAHPHARLVLLTDRQADPAASRPWEVFEPAGCFDEVCYLSVPSRLVDFVRTSRQVRRLTPCAVLPDADAAHAVAGRARPLVLPVAVRHSRHRGTATAGAVSRPRRMGHLVACKARLHD
jgi:hypothetical protein